MKHNNFISTLTIVFIVLKLLGVISWTWWWVLSPLWISALIGLAVWAGFLIFAAVVVALTPRSKK